jgi:hypothetical protein
MSSSAYAAALRLELRPSRQRRRWRILTHLFALAALPWLQSPWLIAAAIVILAGSWLRSRHEPVYVLMAHGDGRWTLSDGRRELTATLAGPAFVQPWLVILPLRIGGRSRFTYIAVFPDMLPAREFRRLRVRMKTDGGRHRGGDA